MKQPLDSQGLVISSGGADGAYAVGVIKALANGNARPLGGQPVDPCVVAGTSIGAFNAACLLGREGSMLEASENLQRIWIDELGGDRFGLKNGAYRFRGNPLDYFPTRQSASTPIKALTTFVEDGAMLAEDWSRRTAKFMSSSDGPVQRIANLFSLSSFVSTSPLREVISRNVSFKCLRESEKTIAINATNATDGRLNTFYNKDLTDENGTNVLLASAAIPGFFPSVEFGGNTYIDGAVVAYTKLSPAINAGARTIHLIHVDPDVAEVAISDPEATLDTLFRMFGVSWTTRVNRGMRDSAHINRQVKFLKEFVRDQNLSPVAARKLFLGLLPKGSFDYDESGEVDGDPIKITIHRYYPAGGDYNALGLLNLSRKRIKAFIDRGYQDALAHDCDANGCILPMD